MAQYYICGHLPSELHSLLSAGISLDGGKTNGWSALPKAKIKFNHIVVTICTCLAYNLIARFMQTWVAL